MIEHHKHTAVPLPPRLTGGPQAENSCTTRRLTLPSLISILMLVRVAHWPLSLLRKKMSMFDDEDVPDDVRRLQRTLNTCANSDLKLLFIPKYCLKESLKCVLDKRERPKLIKHAQIVWKSFSTHSGLHEVLWVTSNKVNYGADWRVCWKMFHNDKAFLQKTNAQFWEAAICQTDVNPKFCSQSSLPSWRCERFSIFFYLGFFKNTKWAGIFSFALTPRCAELTTLVLS